MSTKPVDPTSSDNSNVQGKTVLITGGSSGIGYELAKQFLNLGASKIIITVRSEEAGLKSIESLNSSFIPTNKYSPGIIQFYILKLDDYESVKSFLNKFKSEVEELDILIHNAGISHLDFKTAKTGHEIIMQVNTYSASIITMELLELLKQTAIRRGTASRITLVGSQMMKSQTITPLYSNLQPKTFISQLDSKDKFKGLSRYSDSKYLIHSIHLQIANAEKISSDEIIINTICPGAVGGTGLENNFNPLLRSGARLFKWLVGKNVVEGGKEIVNAATIMGLDSHKGFISNNTLNTKLNEFSKTNQNGEFVQGVLDEILQEFKAI